MCAQCGRGRIYIYIAQHLYIYIYSEIHSQSPLLRRSRMVTRVLRGFRSGQSRGCVATRSFFSTSMHPPLCRAPSSLAGPESEPARHHPRSVRINRGESQAPSRHEHLPVVSSRLPSPNHLCVRMQRVPAPLSEDFFSFRAEQVFVVALGEKKTDCFESLSLSLSNCEQFGTRRSSMKCKRIGKVILRILFREEILHSRFSRLFRILFK